MRLIVIFVGFWFLLFCVDHRGIEPRCGWLFDEHNSFAGSHDSLPSHVAVKFSWLVWHYGFDDLDCCGMCCAGIFDDFAGCLFCFGEVVHVSIGVFDSVRFCLRMKLAILFDCAQVFFQSILRFIFGSKFQETWKRLQFAIASCTH